MQGIKPFLLSLLAVSLMTVGGYAQQALTDIQPIEVSDVDVSNLTADSIPVLATDSVKKRVGLIQKVSNYFKNSNHFDPSKKIDFGIIGGPFYSSATGVGIGLMASGLYRTDRSDETLPLSNMSIFANISTTGMMTVGAKGTNIFPHERYKLDYSLSFYTFPSKIWGIGYDAADNDNNQQKYSRIKFEAKPRFLFRVFDKAYVGPVVYFQYVKMTSLKDEVIKLVGTDETNFMSVGAGLSLNYDSRDVVTNASRGWLFQLDQMFMPSFFGNDHKYIMTDLTVCTYKRAWKGAIIAGEFHSQLNFQDVPWPMMAYVGGPFRMRGYYEGRYRDKSIVEMQVELRQHIWRRNGVAVWVAAANVFPEFDQMRWRKTLLNAGVGYRWAFKENVNVRFDVGVTKNGIGFAFNVNEAF